MQRRYNLTHFLLASVIVLVLTPLIVAIDAQAQIAFGSDRDGNSEIYVMDVDGGNPRRLTNNRHADWSPSWSPDGKRIVFCSDRDGHPFRIPGWFTSEIYVMDADGGNQQNLTNHPSNDRSPSWSPDGTRIAFQSYRDNDRNHNIEIYVMDADGSNLQRITNNLIEDENPAWSPDGERIVFSSAREGHFIDGDGNTTDEIYVMDADGSNLQRITNNLIEDENPAWSPDGERIVFSSAREGHFIDGDGNTTDEIYVMDADGGNQQRLTENRNNDWDPVWSPDGKRIAFMADRKGDFEKFDIYVMDADGGNQQKLTNHRAWDGSPSWSPNGERIVFNSNRDGKSEIYVMDAEGGNLQNLTNNPHSDFGPAWLNTPFSVSPGGKKFAMWGRLKQANR